MNEPVTKIWDATLYLRLSREDGDKEESNSISGQRDLIRDFMAHHPDLREYAVKVDDGFSGSSFERPAFKEMMADIKAGKTNCVIVKDLSRFGRNYLDAGEYIEKIFPFLGVRFIAINDNFDSERERTSSDDLMIPFKNLINEAYCRDISVKIRSQLEIKRKRGEYLGSFAAYGYRKSETDKNQLVIDEYAADVIRDIFKWKLEGASPKAIADRLNSAGILSPMEYKKSLGMKYATSFKANVKALWSAASIIRVLKNPLYIGVLTQGKETTPSYKVHKRISKDEEEWAVVQDSHEAIISKSDYDKVQKVLALDTRTCKDDSVVRLFSGMVFCGDCGASMIRKTVPAGGKKYIYYVCSENKANKKVCSAHSIRDTDLENIVLLSAQQYIQAVIDLQDLLELTDTAPLRTAEAQKVQRQIDMKRGELERYNRLLMSLYESLTDGIINKDEYMRLKQRYSEQNAEAEKQLLALQDVLADIQEHGSASLGWMNEFREHQNITALDRETVVALIERIFVFDDKRVEITFRWHDEYEWQADILQRAHMKEAV